MKKLPRSSSPNSPTDVSQIPRGTPASWLTRWQLAADLHARLEMISSESNKLVLLRLVQRSRSREDLIRRYSNDSML